MCRVIRFELAGSSYSALPLPNLSKVFTLCPPGRLASCHSSTMEASYSAKNPFSSTVQMRSRTAGERRGALYTYVGRVAV